jgi:hypothetical protein
MTRNHTRVYYYMSRDKTDLFAMAGAARLHGLADCITDLPDPWYQGPTPTPDGPVVQGVVHARSRKGIAAPWRTFRVYVAARTHDS